MHQAILAPVCRVPFLARTQLTVMFPCCLSEMVYGSEVATAVAQRAEAARAKQVSFIGIFLLSSCFDALPQLMARALGCRKIRMTEPFERNTSLMLKWVEIRQQATRRQACLPGTPGKQSKPLSV